MTFFHSNFSELSPIQLHDLLKLRQDVFIIEQECLYPDIDGYDDKSSHLLLYVEDQLIGYLRILEPDLKFKESSLGRIVIHPAFRGQGFGPALISEGISVALEQHPQTGIRIEAQSALLPYYRKLGFIEEGEVYIVDDINHIQMVYSK